MIGRWECSRRIRKSEEVEQKIFEGSWSEQLCKTVDGLIYSERWRPTTEERRGDKRTFECFVPLLNLLHSLVVETDRSRCSSSAASLAASYPPVSRSPSFYSFSIKRLSVLLPLCNNHPRMPQQFSRSNPQVPVLLETLHQEVPHNCASPFRKRRTIIVDDSEESWHRVEKVIGRFSSKKFDYESSERPDIRCCSRS